MSTSTVTERAQNLAEAVTVAFMMEVMRDPRVKADPDQYEAVAKEFAAAVDKHQKALMATPQDVVEMLARAGIVVDRVE